jgi:hypothetical protein
MIMRTIIALGTALLASTSAQAAVNLLTNGSFESGIGLAGPTYVATGDSTSINGWVVTAEGVTYTDETPGLGWDAAEGDRSIELSASGGNGGLYQQASGFTVGQMYRLKFNVSANPFDTNVRPRDARVRFSVTGGDAEFYDYALQNVNTATNMLYDTVSYDFIATATMQGVTLRGAVNPYFGYGVVVDNVSIIAVPEAATWMMLVLGFGLVGGATRRRNHAVAA